MSKAKLDQLRQSAAPGESADVLKEVCGYLEQIIRDTRTLTFDLSYPILYELGIEAAVAEWLVDEIQEKHGIETQFEDDNQPKPLNDDIRAILFRNVRELLINVVKHAGARNVKVCIRRVDEQICISVADDGVGFDPVEVEATAAGKAAFGFFSIRARLGTIGRIHGDRRRAGPGQQDFDDGTAQTNRDRRCSANRPIARETSLRRSHQDHQPLEPVRRGKHQNYE